MAATTKVKVIKPTTKFPTKNKVDYRQRNASPPTTEVNRQSAKKVNDNEGSRLSTIKRFDNEVR